MSFYGCYRGICTTNADPEVRKRIKAQVPQVLGKAETDWAWPCLPPGWSQGLLQDHGDPDGTHTHSLRQLVPSPGQAVWIMFEAGDTTKPVWIGVGS